MSDAMTNPASGPTPTGPHGGEALDIRSLDVKTLARKARANQISGNALMGAALGLTVLASALLLWAGIVEGAMRVALLLVAAAMMPLRLLTNRLSALTHADGLVGATNSTVRRWLSHGEAAGLLLAGGFCAFGSGHDMGPVLAGVDAALVVLAGLRGPLASGYWLGLYPTLLLAATAVAAAFEPAWGWRGQTFLVGLNVIGAVLIVHVLRPRGASKASS